MKKSFFILDENAIQDIKKDFEAVKINDEATQLIIKNINDEFNFIIDPHTATGFGAAKKVKGLENLRVADASIMPTLISGNTNGPCMMIGERCAEFIINDN